MKQQIPMIIISLVLAFLIFPLLMTKGSIAASLGSLQSVKDNAGSSVGHTVDVSFWDLTERTDLYCLQHNANMRDTITYRVQDYITISGNTATNRSGTKVTNQMNGILAHIISQNQGYGSDSGVYTEAQKALYLASNRWFNGVGNQLGINWSDDRNNAYGENTVYQEAVNYAGSLGNTQSNPTMKDNTKKDKIKVEQYTYTDGVSYVRFGPFNWNFSGTLSEIKVTDESGKTLTLTNNQSGKKLWASIFSGSQEKWIEPSAIQSDQNFYLTVRADSAFKKITKVEAKGNSGAKDVINARLWFLASSDKQNLLLVDHSTSPVNPEISLEMNVNIPLTVDLTIVKVDADNKKIPLPNVGFILQDKASKKYVKSASGKITYVTDKKQATEFVTDKNGKIQVKGLLVSTYLAYETKNPNYGYELKKDGTEIKSGTTSITITNKQKYVKLSGYVWEDIQSEKMSVRNDYYKKDDFDVSDQLVAGITVRLKEVKTGKVIKEAVTDSNGAYQFTDVEIDKLADYTVEFTYDGLIYQNVIPHLDADNGSKAIEPKRQDYNNNYASVEKGQNENQAAIKDASGQTKATVDYTFTEQENGRTAQISQTHQTEITADTKSANYTLSFKRGNRVTEIKNINLGIYKRTQADLAIKNELDQAKVEIEGYGHIYQYGPTYDSSLEENSWNLGVRFENPYKGIYKRPIYRADAEYENENDRDKELKVALTYKITVANQEALTSQVNQLVDYFDARYTVKGVGTGVSEEDGTITGAIPYEESNHNEAYKKVTIYPNMLIRSASKQENGEQKVTEESIYIQFDLSRQNILNMLNTAKIYSNDENRLDEANQNLKTVAEIESYTSFADSDATTLYAAVDKDSVPGNCTAGDTKTYEDDTDKASNLAITIANAREVSGTVFEDSENEEFAEKNISQGDAIFDPERENVVGGVKVQLVKVDSSGNITDEVAKIFDEQYFNEETGELGKWTEANAETLSRSDGTYNISGFIPGRYALKYTWGNGTTYKIVDGKETPDQTDYYNSMVENYKATVIDYETAQKEKQDNHFYRAANESETRTSHAMDDTNLRKTIDENLKHYNYTSEANQTPKEMVSKTPIMQFNIEYDDNDLMSIDLNRVENRVAFKIKNVDFGIIKRPTQRVNFVKSLSEIRITLANGQVLINAQIDDEGNMTGQTNYLTYVKPVKENGITVQNGFLKAELDSEIIQGATVQMKYKLRTENTSQADYVDEPLGYYQYGESYYQKVVQQEKKENDIITITPSKIVDYLDEKSIYRPDDEVNVEYRWRPMTLDELKTEGLVAGNVTEALETGKYIDENGQEQTLDETQIYTTDYLNRAKLKPYRYVGEQPRSAEGGDVYMVVDKVLNSSDDANFENQAELVLLDKPGGSKPTSTPGNYVPNKTNQETDDSTSQEVIVTPSTGGNRSFILPIAVGMVALVILGVGIYFIKKKVT